MDSTFPAHLFDGDPAPSSVVPLEDIMEESATKGDPALAGATLSSASSESIRPPTESTKPSQLARCLRKSLKNGCTSKRNYNTATKKAVPARNKKAGKNNSATASLKGKKPSQPSKTQSNRRGLSEPGRVRKEKESRADSEVSESDTESSQTSDDDWSVASSLESVDSSAGNRSELSESSESERATTAEMARKTRATGRSLSMCSRCRKPRRKRRAHRS